MRLPRSVPAACLMAAVCAGAPVAGQAADAAAAHPGTLTASADLPAAFTLPDAGKSLRITYLSTNGLTGKGLVPVTAEVILPAGTPPPGGWPVVAWAHGTVGVADHCAPSANPWTDRNRRYLSTWMKRGFAVVGTDYQGLGTPGIHPYLNTRVEAYSLLDGVRAALTSVPGLQNKIMVVGQSQGGGAAFAASAYAPAYAPDLNIRGTVATGAPYLSPELLKQMLSSPSPAEKTAAFNPVMVYTLYLAQGLSGYDPEFSPEKTFTPRAMSAWHASADLCVYPLTDKVKHDGLTFGNSLRPEATTELAPAIQAMAYPTMKLDADFSHLRQFQVIL